MDFKLATPFLEAFEELDKLNESPLKTWRISYYEDGVKKSFTVQAASKEEAEQIGWSRVDTDSLYVSEVISEAASTSEKIAASKKFWASAKIGKMEEDAFHTAFDDELKELGLMDMFDANGVLENNYGRIADAKRDHPESWAAKALGSLWGLRYGKNRSYIYDNLFKSEKEARDARQKAAEEAKAKSVEEQKRIRAEKLNKYQQLMLTYLRKVDADTVDKYEETIGVPVLDGVTVEETFISDSQWTENLDQEYKVCFEGWDRCYKVKESKLNDEAYMLKTLKTGLEKAAEHSGYKDAVEEFKQKISVLAVPEHQPQVLLLGDSGTIYELRFILGELKMSIDGESPIPVRKIDEPYEVIYTVVRQSNDNYHTTVDNESRVFYSWNSKYESMLGNRIPHSFGRQAGGLMGSYTETTRLTAAQATGPNFCHADGINSWAKQYSRETATG